MEPTNWKYLQVLNLWRRVSFGPSETNWSWALVRAGGFAEASEWILGLKILKTLSDFFALRWHIYIKNQAF